MRKVVIDGETLTIEDVIAVARRNAIVTIPRETEKKVKKSREILERLKERKAIYGVNTGFGAFGNITIAAEDIKELQVNLIRSHSSGVGNPLKKDVTR
ncbi:aromatic amino acid lyase, partial [Candidatus Bathyarchaeota archaeon]|nr:aromatic amino acid lyase [Candidatus Bathyarchaeota archaeon]